MKKRILSMILAVMMLIPLASMMTASAAVSGTNALSGNTAGKVMYDENYFKTNIATAFTISKYDKTVEGQTEKVPTPTAAVTWNDTTGRIQIKSEASAYAEMVAIPADLYNYTLQAELYIVAGTGKKVQFGFNTGNKIWANGTDIQFTEGTKTVYLQNQGVGASNASYISYDLNRTWNVGEKTIVRLTVSDSYAVFTVYYNNTKFTFPVQKLNTENGVDLSALAFPFGSGSPFFGMHGGVTLEVDNLTVYAGTTVAEPDLSGGAIVEQKLPPVYYPNGTVIFSENDIKAPGADLTKMFKANNDKTTVEWNATTDRLKISATAASIVDIIAVPKNLGYFTIKADLYLTENNTGDADNAIFGVGINSATSWAKSTYFQFNVKEQANSTVYYLNNNGPTVSAGGSAASPTLPGYDVNETKISVTMRVSDTMFECYVNDTYLTMFTLDKLGYELGEGSPWFFQRQNTTIEIDNLIVYSGIGEPDATKTMANQTPLTAPDIQEEDLGGDAGDNGNDNGNNSGNNGGFFGGDDEEEDEADETTAAATTAAATTAAKKDDAAKEEKKGCGSTVGLGVFGIMAFGAAACTVKRKRK